VGFSAFPGRAVSTAAAATSRTTASKRDPAERQPARTAAARHAVITELDLIPPRPPRPSVLRPRLLATLETAPQRRVTLVSAPPGSGKTALLATWLANRSDDRIAWLSVHGGCGESVFWAEFLEAFRRLGPVAAPVAALAPPRGTTPPRFVAHLLNALLELRSPVTVVLDDLQRLRGRSVEETIGALVNGAPESVSFVIATRSDPAIRLHALRVAGDLKELRANDLRFTHEEADELLEAFGIRLSNRELARVLAVTEGWAVGLRLFALSRSDGAESVELAVDDRPAAEYLTAEVLDRQHEERRLFLLRTSIASRLTPELADVLTDRTDAGRELEALMHQNLFVERAGGSQPVYRYHAMFRALLAATLKHERRDEVQQLHRAAARWYTQEQLPLEAVEHALEAEDVPLASAAVASHWFQIYVHGAPETWLSLLTRVPERKLARSAVLSAACASLQFAAGDRWQAVERLDRAAASPEPDAPGARAVVTFAKLLRREQEGSSSRVATHARALLRTAEREPLPALAGTALRTVALEHLGLSEVWLGDSDAEHQLEEALGLARETGVVETEVSTLGGLAILQLEHGKLRRASRLATAALEAAEPLGDETLRTALAHAVLACVAREWHDEELAEEHRARLAAAARRGGRYERVLCAVVDASVSLWRGDVEGGLQRLRGASRDLRAIEAPRLSRSALCVEARLLGALDETGKGLELVETALRQQPMDEELLLTRARLQLAAGRHTEAAQTLEAAGDVTGDAALGVERSVLLAVALRADGEDEAARHELAKALAAGEAEGVRRPFLEAGSAVRELLAAHLRHSASHRWYATELLRELDGKGQGGVPAELLEPLSAREREVLRYLQTMMSNADIAAELFVSVNTVKTHVKSIYRKLAATKRQDAVRRARQLQLL
jgi:LuxR family maltose regulon positive regulatory protein